MNECVWKEKKFDNQPNQDGQYLTSCGEFFNFEKGGPSENDYKFCCFCGKPLKEVPSLDIKAVFALAERRKGERRCSCCSATFYRWSIFDLRGCLDCGHPIKTHARHQIGVIDRRANVVADRRKEPPK